MQDLLDRLNTNPGNFSPAANLRPILQDALLPTAVSILGPGEWAYHLQLKEVYAFHSIPRPAFARRFEFMLLPPRIQKGLSKSGISLEDLKKPVEQLVKEVALSESPINLDSLLQSLRDPIQQSLDELQSQIHKVDNSLKPAIIKSQKQLLRMIDQLETRIGRSLRKNSEQIENSLARLQSLAYPDGKPQERILNVFYFLNLFGTDWISLLEKHLEQIEPELECRVRIEHESKKSH